MFVVILALIAGAGLAWYIYFYNGSPDTGGVVSTADSGGVRSGILSNIEVLKSIKLDTTVLSDPAFARLQKVILPVVAEPSVGRPNPFLPYKAKTAPSPSSRGGAAR